MIPDDVYDIVFLGDAEDVVLALAEENGLSKEEADLLTFEVESVFLGDAPTGEFPDKIKQKLRLPEEKLQKIISFIKEELFNPFSASIEEAYRQKVNQRMGATEIKENKPRVVTVPVSNTPYAPAAPVYRPDGFGKPQTQKNFDILLSQEEGPVAYQSGVSLKDSLLGESGPQNGAANPMGSSFAKKLDALDAMAKGKTTNAPKEDKYRENPNS